MDFDSNTREDRSLLERLFLEEEIHNIILGMKGDKVLCPYGFTISFFFL